MRLALALLLVASLALTSGLELSDCSTPTLTLSASSAHVGDSLVASASGLVPSDTYFFVLGRPTISPLIRLSGKADENGSAEIQFTLPVNKSQPANYTASVACRCDGKTVSASVILTVTAAPAESDVETDPVPCPTPSVLLDSKVARSNSVVMAMISLGGTSALPFTVRVARPRLAPLLTIQGTTDVRGNAKVSLLIPADAPSAQFTVGVSVTCPNGQSAIGTAPLAISNPTNPHAPSHPIAPRDVEFPTVSFAPRPRGDCASPQMLVSSPSVKAGSSFKIHISSLPANAAVIVRVAKLGLSPLLTLPFTSDATGTLDAVITVPATAPTGAYGVGATAQCNGSPIVAVGSISIV